MGNQKDAKKNEGEKETADAAGWENKPAAVDGGGKKDEEPINVVLKMDLHCEGCAKKVRRSISRLEGVMKVKVDCNAKKLIVTGNVDPAWLRHTVENKTKKKVELISPSPTAGGGAAPTAADKKPVEKPEDDKAKEKKGTEDNNNNNKNPKEAVVSTVVMKIKLHCDACAQKIEKVIARKIAGVNSVKTDLQKDLVILNGTMDVKKLTSYLKEKLKRNVDILTPSKKEDNGDKTAKDDGSGGGEKKEKETADGDEKENKSEQEETKIEVNKMEYNNNYNLQTYYTAPMFNHTSYVSQEYSHHPYSDNGYMVQYRGPPTPPPTYLNMDHSTFSDENPNGCFVM